jgi:hypothetical protein
MNAVEFCLFIAFCLFMAGLMFVLQRASRKHTGMSLEWLLLTKLFRRW